MFGRDLLLYALLYARRARKIALFEVKGDCARHVAGSSWLGTLHAVQALLQTSNATAFWLVSDSMTAFGGHCPAFTALLVRLASIDGVHIRFL